MKPQPRKPRRPLFPLTIAGAILLTGGVAVALTNGPTDPVPLPLGVIGLVLIVIGLGVKARP